MCLSCQFEAVFINKYVTSAARSSVIFGHMETMTEVREVRAVNPGNSGNNQVSLIAWLFSRKKQKVAKTTG